MPATAAVRFDPDRREAVRLKALAETPRRYNPWVHLAVPSLIGATLVVSSLLTVHDPGLPELGFVLLIFVLANANEWRIHKHMLHRRSWPLGVLYERHTPEHHMIYTQDDMAMRSRQEFRLVLIPIYGIVALFVVTLPVPITLAWLGYWNFAALYVAVSMAYVVSYEWLHLSYHFPPDSFVGRLRLVRVLRQQHATHHNPELMQRWNFNVTLPLWDWVMGTTYREKTPV